MKALIIDDDKRICNLIKSLLKSYFETVFECIDIATTLKEGFDALNNKTYNLLLLDIHLGKKTTSFDLLNRISLNKSKLIFITGHEHYAIQAIKSGALDYILKPIQTKEFKQAIEKAIKEILRDPKHDKANQFIKRQDHSLILKDLEQIRIVKLNDILYLKAGGPYTDIYLEGNEKITVSKHLKDFETKLDGTGFYRIHNSYMINSLKMIGIVKKDGFSVKMKTGDHIAISGRRKDEFLKFIENNLQV